MKLAVYAGEKGFFVAPEEAGSADAERQRVSPYYHQRWRVEKSLAEKQAEYDEAAIFSEEEGSTCQACGAQIPAERERCPDCEAGSALIRAEIERARRERSRAAEEAALPLLRAIRSKDLVALFAAELGRLLEDGITYADFQSAQAAERQIKRARRDLRGVS